MLRTGLIGKKPDQSRNFDRKKTYFFLIWDVVTQNLSNFSPEPVTCPKRKQESFSQRGKLLLAPPGLNQKPHGQLPNPNECNSTLTSGNRGYLPLPLHIDIDEQGHRLCFFHAPWVWGYLPLPLHIDIDEQGHRLCFFHAPWVSDESNQEKLGNDWKTPSALKAVSWSSFHG